MGIFKAYDVRGTYPDQVNEALFEAIGQAAPQVLKCKNVVVSRDMREYEALTRRLFAQNELVDRYGTLVALDRVKAGMELVVP